MKMNTSGNSHQHLLELKNNPISQYPTVSHNFTHQDIGYQRRLYELLLEGAQDPNGYIIIHRHASGLFVQDIQKHVGEDDNHRSQALWVSGCIPNLLTMD